MNFLKKYRHGFVILFFSLAYLVVFHFLETREITTLHIIHTRLDDMIPFNEYFIIPYLVWFPYQVISFLYFIFINKDKQEYYQLTKNICMGMTIFLVISFLFPNGLQLRPAVFARDTIFTQMVAWLYATDTPTNVLPSIHVFNSLVIHFALARSALMKKHPGLVFGSLVLTISIVLSTIFLKQHSVIDVIAGMAMAMAGYIVFYKVPETRQTASVSPSHLE
ncbi:MAG: phosphoesterase [Lachnospiraceae bacterium]